MSSSFVMFVRSCCLLLLLLAALLVPRRVSQRKITRKIWLNISKFSNDDVEMLFAYQTGLKCVLERNPASTTKQNFDLYNTLLL